jgi:hypothetical protein
MEDKAKNWIDFCKKTDDINNYCIEQASILYEEIKPKLEGLERVILTFNKGSNGIDLKILTMSISVSLLSQYNGMMDPNKNLYELIIWGEYPQYNLLSSVKSILDEIIFLQEKEILYANK